MKPHLVVAADWSKSWEGRWQVEALLDGDSYSISHPTPVGPPDEVVPDLLKKLSGGKVGLLGLDFPIGLPRQYASYRACRSFPDWLAEMDDTQWEHFSRPTDDPSLLQPFAPKSNTKDGLKKEELARALGLTIAGLYRSCDRQTLGYAAPVFFTRFASQVGKAALHGWNSVVRPHRTQAKFWPFDGWLHELFEQEGLVVVEIYPAAMSVQLGIPPNGRRTRGKNSPSYRRSAGSIANLERNAGEVGAEFTSSAREWIKKGFAGGHDFDALVSLLGMLSILNESQDGGLEGKDPGGVVRSVEGWIFGLRTETNKKIRSTLEPRLQDEVCCSVVGLLGEIFGEVPADIRRPDMEERQEQAVDLSFRLGRYRFVLEHTRIEAYDGRIRDDAIARALYEALEDALGTFSLLNSKLHLEVPNRVPLSERQAKKIAPILSDWIRETAPRLEIGGPRVAPRHFRRANLPGLHFEVALYRWPSERFF